MEDFKAALLKAMFANDNLEKITLSNEEIQAIERLKTEKYATWDWNYGKSPQYNLRKRKCDFGLITVLLQVEKGEIKDLHFYGDYFGNGDIQELKRSSLALSRAKQPCPNFDKYRSGRLY